MQRTQKEQLVATLHEGFEQTRLMVVTHQVGMTVAELTRLRVRMREAGCGFKVTKNRLAKRALDGTPFQSLASLFTGPTAVAFSVDPVAAARIAVQFANENDKLVIVGGALGERVLDVAGVKALATLPSLDELRGKFLGLLQAPATRVATVLQAPGSQLARVLSAFATKDAA